MRGNHRQGLIDERYFKIEDLGHGTPCWIWQRATVGERGYGQVSFKGESMVAHRAVWIERIGPWPEGLQADHLCRNRLCVNPEHIEPVTQSVNQRRGMMAKLTDSDRLTITLLYEQGWAVRALARHYDCTRDTIMRTLGVGCRWGPGGTGIKPSHSPQPRP